jgi:hypothetical protein
MLELRHKEAIDRYVNEGCPTGRFLQFVLENDLCNSFGYADEQSRANLYDIIKYLYNDVPGSCWGSKEKVKNWFAKFNQVPER